MSLKSYNPLRTRHDLVLTNLLRASNCSRITDLKTEILKFSTDIGIFESVFNCSESTENDMYPPSIIIDNGTHMIKSGFSNDTTPTAVFDTVTGRLKHKTIMVGIGSKDIYIGDEALSKRGILNLSYPMKNGIINNWNEMESIWSHLFVNELRVDSSEYNVLITEKPLNTYENRSKMTEIMFETFNTPKMFIVPDQILSLYATGRTSGVVVNIGYDMTQIVPIYSGYCIPYGIKTLKIGGKHITDHFTVLWNKRGYNFHTTAQKEIVNHTKEKIGFVATNFDETLENATKASLFEKHYEMPSGQIIVVSKERFCAPEVLFKPNEIGVNNYGIDKLTFNSIISCETEIRKLLFNNIVLSGGSSMFDGLDNRMIKELNLLKSKSNINCKMNVIANPERQYSALIGGCMIANNEYFQKYWVNKEEYKEYGTNIVYRKYV